MNCANLEELTEQLVPCITHNAPGVKLGTIKFVEKATFVTYIDILKNCQGEILPAIAKVVDDKDPGVRQAALHCVGVMVGRLGDDVVSKYLKNVNS